MNYDVAAREIAQLMEEAREKDAEIERLKVRLLEAYAKQTYKEWERNQELITEMADALQTTCDLLKRYGHYVKHGTDLEQRARKAIFKAREKDAEIERLKEENAHFAWRDQDKNKLITELADALEQWVKIEGNTHPDWALSQRARKAIESPQ